MRAKLEKWGNGLALRIPRAFAREAHLTEGSEVALSIQDGKIIVDPSPAAEYSLDDLLSGVTNRNRHSEIDIGDAQGHEAW